MASRRIFFVGKPPSDLFREFPHLEMLRYALVLREARPRAVGTVLVLDLLCLARLDPVLLGSSVRAPYTRVLLVPGPITPPSQLSAWRKAGFDDIAAPGDLARALREAARDPVVVRVPDAAWIPGVVGDPDLAADLLRAVPRLPRPSVEEWAERAGVDPRTLRSRCRACFDRSPGQLLWMRTDALVRQERSRGIPVDVLAHVAGFRDRHALYHSYRDRGVPFPPAGPGSAAPPAGESVLSRTVVENRPAESDSRHFSSPDEGVGFERSAGEHEKSTDSAGRPNVEPPASG